MPIDVFMFHMYIKTVICEISVPKSSPLYTFQFKQFNGTQPAWMRKHKKKMSVYSDWCTQTFILTYVSSFMWLFAFTVKAHSGWCTAYVLQMTQETVTGDSVSCLQRCKGKYWEIKKKHYAWQTGSFIVSKS